MSVDAALEVQEQSEIQMLRKAARGFLEEEWPVEHAVENCEKPEAMRELFKKVAAQGWTSLGGDPEFPDSAEMLTTLCEEVGSASAALALADTYAINMILRSGEPLETSQAVLRGLQEGTCAVSVAFTAFDGDANAGSVEVTGREQKRLKGAVRFVEGLAIADFVLVVVGNSEIALVRTTGEGVKITLTPGLAVPALGDVEFDNAPVTVVSVPQGLLEEASAIARLASTARALGAASRSFELAVEHVKVRVQFGQPVGKFQAVQHKLADCSIWLTATRGLIDEAVEAYQTQKPTWRVRADAARTFASTNLRKSVLNSQRMFGGLGFWIDHQAPRLFRRVHAELMRFGGVSTASNYVADYLLNDGSSSRTIPAHDYGKSGEAFRKEFRTWLEANYPKSKRLEKWRTLPRHEQVCDAEFARALGQAGYIGVSWPKEAGGRGLTFIEDYVMQEETFANDLPFLGYGNALAIVGPTLLQFGTPEQIKKYIPKILRGELVVVVGYSAPEGGFGLASLTTKAVRDGDEWVINGSKIHQSECQHSDYTWLAVRTDPNAPKHKGISLFLLPLNLPGITVRPEIGLNGYAAGSIFYDNVRVPGDCLIGNANEGWKIIVSALAHERMMIGAFNKGTAVNFDAFLQFLVSTVGKGQSPTKNPMVREKVGTVAAEIMAGDALSLIVLKAAQSGRTPISEAAMVKCFCSETEELSAKAVLDILGTIGTLDAHAPGNVLDGKFEYLLRNSIASMTGGGTAEIQRNIIATAGLGLPRS